MYIFKKEISHPQLISMKHNLRDKFHFVAYLTQFVWRIFFVPLYIWFGNPPPTPRSPPRGGNDAELGLRTAWRV
jgi:hypothetical protein